ncbi:PEP-CTERM protein-sorting domain-containing protein [Nitrosospira sp. Nsp14]|uniref:PEP-CTERM sorting domain-containing protein n=1 Tax=Nitrosospira sp. Nsp14 TaxID=1855333 RepID=UPI0008E6EF7A|nr:PEP-CTERM sorting domain-containing protein [Nitrosospira sp. Nsp14]SFH45005.1 PEP-CTERM protein-sorting domain-containing protein [Nitrosospira sp. Nsp14]
MGGSFTEAYGINDAGQVVGWSYSANAQHAFITGPDGAGMIDLNSLSLVGLPAGVVLESATGVNNAGQVIAAAIPDPETYMLLLSGLALVGFIARRKKMDARAPCLE